VKGLRRKKGSRESDPTGKISHLDNRGRFFDTKEGTIGIGVVAIRKNEGGKRREETRNKKGKEGVSWRRKKRGMSTG